MKKCEKCNENFADEMNFCPMCGGKLVESGNICKSCGKEVPAQFRFCPYCGGSMEFAEEKIENDNDENMAVDEEDDGFDLDDLFDDDDDDGDDDDDDDDGDDDVDDLKFKIGNLAFEYEDKVDDVKFLRKACLDISQSLEKLCEDYLEGFNGIIPLLNDHVENKLENTLEAHLKPLVDTFVKLGYYDLDFDDVWSDYRSNSSFRKLQGYLEAVRDAAIEIEEWVQSERDRREYRKETRTQLVGGGFGLKAAAVGMAKAGAVNMTTGAAHSVFNFFGNMSTDSKASDQRAQLFKNVKENLPDLFSSAGLNFNHCIEAQIGASYSSVNINKINDKIEEGLIAKDDIVPILLKNLRENPFVSRTYSLLLEHVSDEYAYDIYKMASFFKITSDDDSLRYADDDYTFLEEFEAEHSLYGNFVDNKKEYDEIQRANEILLELRDTYDVEDFFDDDMECYDDDDMEETIEKLLVSCDIEKLRKTKENVIGFKKEVQALNGENVEGVEDRKERFALCNWFLEEIIDVCDEVVSLSDKAMPVAEAMHNGDVEKFIELDSARKSSGNRGWDYLGAKTPIAYDIALCYFLLGATKKDSECEFGIGLLYNDRMTDDPSKCKYWIKIAANSGCKKAQEALRDNHALFDKGRNIDFEQAVAGDEFKGTFAAYALPDYVQKCLDDVVEKQRTLLEECRIEQFFAMDYYGFDNYTKAKHYAAMKQFARQNDIVMAYYIRGALKKDAKCQYQLARYYAKHAKSWGDSEKVKYWMTCASENGLNEATKYMSDNKKYFDEVNDISENEALGGMPSDYIFTNHIISKKMNVGKKTSPNDKNNNKKTFYIDKNNTAFKSLDWTIQSLNQEGSFYVYGKINATKLASAFSNYASGSGISKDDVVFYYDSTFFGGGEDGFVLGTKCMVSDKCRKSLYYSELEYIRVRDHEVYVKRKYDSGEAYFVGNSSRSELRIIMEAFYKLLGGKAYKQDNEDYYAKIEF